MVASVHEMCRTFVCKIFTHQLDYMLSTNSELTMASLNVLGIFFSSTKAKPTRKWLRLSQTKTLRSAKGAAS